MTYVKNLHGETFSKAAIRKNLPVNAINTFL